MKASEVLRRYKAGERNFQRLNLRGQFFKGQDLSGADFSEADIRSTNFTGATLIGAKFCGAKCGLQRRWATLLTILSWLLAGISGFLLLIGGAFVSLILDDSSLENQIAGWVSLIVLVVLLIVVIRWGIRALALALALAVVLALVFAVAFVAASAFALAGAVAKAVAEALAGALVFAVAFVAAFALVFALALAFALAVALAGALAGAVAEALGVVLAGAFAFAGAGLVALTGVLAVALAFALAGMYIGWSAMKGDKREAWIRSFAIAFAATGGTSFRGADLTEANFTGARLKSTDLRKANLTRVRWYGAKMLDRVRLGDTYLQYTQVRQWLIGKGIDKNFDRKILRGINLQGANLAYASFIGADLSEANLRDTDLSTAKLVQAQLEGTDLTGATLTAATIEDWNINSETNFENVICDYIYLKEDQQERRPSDPNRNFEPGEFAKLVEKYIETVDLIFKDGIDWRAFLTSFQDLRVEYGNENVSIQAIEKKSDGAFVIRLSVPPEADKAEIESKAKQSYETNLKVLEAQYRGQLQAKEEQIAIYRHHNASLENIVNTLASAMSGDRIINTGGGEYRETNLQDDSRYVETRDSSTYYENYNSPQEKTLAEAADEIQKLLQQLEQTNPTSTTSEQIVVAAQAIKRIESDPTWKQRVINAAKEGGLAAFEKALDNPAGAFITSAVKGWLEAE